MSIKWNLSTVFYSQTDSPTKWQNSIIKVYLSTFVNYKKDNWAKLLPMAEFAYNNAKNASIRYTSFELNCRYYPRISNKKNINLRFRSKAADELTEELRNLMAACRKNL